MQKVTCAGSKKARQRNEDFGSLAVIGNIIPGLIANWMDRQGVTRTISVIILTSVLVKLIIMLLFGGQLFE